MALFIGPPATASLIVSGGSPRWATVCLAALSSEVVLGPNQADTCCALVSIVPGQAPFPAPVFGLDLISQLARPGESWYLIRARTVCPAIVASTDGTQSFSRRTASDVPDGVFWSVL